MKQKKFNEDENQNQRQKRIPIFWFDIFVIIMKGGDWPPLGLPLGYECFISIVACGADPDLGKHASFQQKKT